MSHDWISQELETADLEDKRLNDRFAEVLKALSARPHVSIPTACGGHAETIAAHRFFDNEKTTFHKIITPHRDATVKRISEHEVVLCVQDTTELDLTRPQQPVRGSGLIGTSKTRRGAYLHLLEAFTPDGTPLGAVWAKTIIRREEETRTPEEIKARDRSLRYVPIEEKESFRWLEGYRETISLAAANDKTTSICIGDSESDIFEVFAETRTPNAHLLIRMAWDRRLVEKEGEFNHLRNHVDATPVLATKNRHIRVRPTKSVSFTKNPREQIRKSRDTKIEIRKATAIINAPNRFWGKRDPVTLNVVVVSEPHPPEGESPIEAAELGFDDSYDR